MAEVENKAHVTAEQIREAWDKWNDPTRPLSTVSRFQFIADELNAALAPQDQRSKAPGADTPEQIIEIDEDGVVHGDVSGLRMSQAEKDNIIWANQQANRLMAHLTGIDDECPECEHSLKGHHGGACSAPGCGCMRGAEREKEDG